MANILQPLAFIQIARYSVPPEPSCLVDRFRSVGRRCKQRLTNKALGSAERTAPLYRHPGGEASFKVVAEA